ncbi:hypothetical protein B0H19DRAFT_1277049 [Mycena capillaripes]|nr:hypothetical protein B0H19DRAFT_1277049 [Mycena capillaripes]
MLGIISQFSAVANLAISDIYGGYWIGPPSANFSGGNQTIALGALLSAIGLEAATSLSSPSLPVPPVPSDSETTLPNSHNLAVILGGILGGFAVVALAGFILYLRRRGKSSQNSSPPHALLQPFTEQAPVPITSTSLLPRPQYARKRDRPESALISSIAHPFAIDGPTSQSMPPLSAPAVHVERVSAPDFLMEQLVRILAQRLQYRQWDDQDTPPEYPAA